MADSAIANLRAVHGLYNFTVMLLFFYQASLGLRVRRGRKTGHLPTVSVKNHRRNGPIFVVMAGFGYLAGLTITFIDQGQILVFLQHFLVGTLLVLSIAATYFVSLRINGNEIWRDRHFRVGIFILTIFILQVFLGIKTFILKQSLKLAKRADNGQFDGFLSRGRVGFDSRHEGNSHHDKQSN